MATQPADYPFPGEDAQEELPEGPITPAVYGCSKTMGSLVEALAKAQLEFKTIKKNRTATVKTKTGGQYSYKYADLNAVIDATRPALAKNGIVIMQFPEVDIPRKLLTVRSLMAHVSGEWQESRLTLPATQREDFDAQSIAGAMSYARRYQWHGLIGIASEDDDASRAVNSGSKEAQLVVGRQKVTELRDQLQQSVDSLFYVWYDESQTAEIKGSPVLMEKYSKLLKPLLTSVNGKKTIVANAEQFDSLKYELERAGVPFYPLKANT